MNGRAEDEEYLAAVDAGDLVAAAAMVALAAGRAGYAIGPVLHGTARRFHVFDVAGRRPNVEPWRFEGRRGAFFTEDRWEAEAHARHARIFGGGRAPRVLRAYLKIERPHVRKTGGKRCVSFFDANWRQIQAMAETKGADGIIIRDTHPEGHRIFVVFDPRQIKSADPVVRDAAGRVIPLSRRFDPSSADIRGTIGAAFPAERAAPGRVAALAREGMAR